MHSFCEVGGQQITRKYSLCVYLLSVMYVTVYAFELFVVQGMSILFYEYRWLLLVGHRDDKLICLRQWPTWYTLALFYNTFIIILYMFRALYAHHQEVELYWYSIWYRHSVSGRAVHRTATDWRWRYQMLHQYNSTPWWWAYNARNR